MDKKNRWGFRKIAGLAHQKFRDLASENLSEEDIDIYNSESGSRGYVAQHSPKDDWSSIVGFTPDDVFYSEITIGLAVDPGESPDIYARILACKEKDHEFFHFIWR